MKKYVSIIAALSILAACNNNQKRQEAPVVDVIESEVVVEAPRINIKDSLRTQEGLGNIVEHQYEGLLPAADGPGIQYDLSLFAQENSKKGVFDLNTTYKSAENGKDKSFQTVGNYEITEKKEKNKKEIIYELKPLDGTDAIYFILNGENLTLLDRDKKEIISTHNYTLNKKK